MRRIRTVQVLLAAALAAVVPLTAAAQSSATGSRWRIPTHQVTVVPTVRGAQLYVDGVRQVQVGVTEFVLDLAPGTYTFRIEARGYQPWQERVIVTRGRIIRVTLLPATAIVLLGVPQEYLNDEVRDPLRLIEFRIDGRRVTANRVEVESGYRWVTIVSGGLKIESRFYFEAGREYTLDLILRASLTDRFSW